ncbi:unnamed protein product [Prunus brigantina]
MLEVVVCGLLKGLAFVLNIVTCWHPFCSSAWFAFAVAFVVAYYFFFFLAG